jgi:aryl-alcohol dehydrogenase-like predicted oxidoreductase
MAQTDSAVQRRAFGRTGVDVASFGIGGYHLVLSKDRDLVTRIVAMALDAGANFVDTAWEYHEGLSEDLLGYALKGRRHEVFLMSKVCTHGRDRALGMRMLEDSLRRLQTDHLDLWQLHELNFDNDPELAFRPDGGVEALAQAKREGKVRFVGFTGHKDPSIHLKMLSYGFAFDAVQMPLSAFDATFRSFERQVLPEVNRLGMAAIGMKVMGGGGEPLKTGVITAAEGLRYALSLPATTILSGMDSLEVAEENLAAAKSFAPMNEAEMTELRERVRPYAADGRVELFKTTAKYDGPVVREQHGYPPPSGLPL